MKNIKHLLLFAFIAIAAMACRKEAEPGGVAVQEMCGEWIVYTSTPPFDRSFRLYTTNTSDNDPAKIRLSDKQAFWGFNFVANCNYGARTFSSNEALSEHYYVSNGEDKVFICNITVTDGQIIENGVTTLPSGTLADKIVFKIGFSDDDTPYTMYEFVGYRHSGFAEDEGYVYKGE